MRLATRIQINTLLVLCAILGVGYLQYIYFQESKNLQKQRAVAIKISKGVFELNFVTYDYLHGHSMRSIKQWRRRYRSLSKLIAGLQVESGEKYSIVESLKADQRVVQKVFLKLSDYYQNIVNKGDAEKFSNALEERLAGQLLIYTQQMASNAQKLESRIYQKLTDKNRQVALNVMFLIGLCLVVIYLFNYVLVRRRIIKPLELLLVGINEFGRGDLRTKMDLGEKDEIGQLARAFDQMAKSIEKVTVSRDDLAREVYERERAEEALKIAHDKLLHVEKLSAIGGLSASIAHEFNNPLQGVLTVIKGVQRRAHLDEKDTRLVEMAICECNRMKNLVKSLREFNKPSSGVFAPVDLHAIIDSLLLLSKKEYVNKGIRIITNYGDNVPYINAVADQVKQVLLNLLNNAAYACHGGGTISIKTRVVEEKNVAIQVHDTGTGIKPEVIPHIYEPFFSTKPAVKGTGLGLSISYGILKEHGGSIDVQSEPGKGTTFTVSLPIQAASKRSNNKSGGA